MAMAVVEAEAEAGEYFVVGLVEEHEVVACPRHDRIHIYHRHTYTYDREGMQPRTHYLHHKRQLHINAACSRPNSWVIIT